MTKKGYELIARVFALNKPDDDMNPALGELRAYMCMSMAHALTRENARFKRTEFLAACEFSKIAERAQICRACRREVCQCERIGW